MTDPNMLLCCEAPVETNVDPGGATVALKQPPPPPPAQSLFTSWLGDPQVNAAPPPPPPAAAAEDPAASPAAPPPAAEPAVASSMSSMGLPTLVALPDLPTMPILSLGGEPEALTVTPGDDPQYVRGRPNRGMQSFKVPDPSSYIAPPPPRPPPPPPPAPPLSVPKRAVGANGKKGPRPRFTNTTQMKLFYMDGLEVHHSRAPSRVRSCSSPPRLETHTFCAYVEFESWLLHPDFPRVYVQARSLRDRMEREYVTSRSQYELRRARLAILDPRRRGSELAEMNF